MPELTLDQIQTVIERQLRESLGAVPLTAPPAPASPPSAAAPPAHAASPAAAKRSRSKSVTFTSEVDGEYPPLSRCVSSYDCLLHGLVGFVFELCFTVNTSSLIFFLFSE